MPAEAGAVLASATSPTLIAAPSTSTLTNTPSPTFRLTRTSTSTSTLTATRTPLPFSSGAIQIGFSVAGRPIEVYRFGIGPSKRMIIAGIHGGYEWNTIELAYQLIEQIEQNPDLIPTQRSLYILPVLNPDGEAREHGAAGRANEHGVDLNRNFPIGWMEDWNRSGCWQLAPITAGPYPLSEPESMALAKFLHTHRIEALISYHSYGMGIYPGGAPADEKAIALARAIASVSDFPYPPFETGCQYTGMLADFAVSLGIAAVDLELTTRWDTELAANLAVLRALLAWEP